MICNLVKTYRKCCYNIKNSCCPKLSNPSILKRIQINIALKEKQLKEKEKKINYEYNEVKYINTEELNKRDVNNKSCNNVEFTNRYKNTVLITNENIEDKENKEEIDKNLKFTENEHKNNSKKSVY